MAEVKNDETKKQKVAVENKVESNKKVEVKEKPFVKGDLHSFEVVLYPLISEKAVNMIDSENKITFIVDKKATKDEIKKVLETLYGVKVEKVNIIKDMKGRKKAIVKLNKSSKAEELATKLGVL